MAKAPFSSILIPTDFSACAQHAVEAGLSLGQRFGVAVHLLHVVPPPSNWSTAAPDRRRRYEEQLAQAREQLEAIPVPDGLDVRRSVRTENLYEAVNSYVAESGIGLVVMGSHGMGGKSEFFIGSNTQRTVRKVHCPVMVLKEPIRDWEFDKVLFASRFHTDELPAFRRFLEFVRPFLPEIHLVEVHTGSIFDPLASVSHDAMRKFKREAGSLPCFTHLYRDLNPDRGIRNLAAELGADLIGISNHHRHPLKRLLSGSTVEALINHSGLPVLSIDFEKS